MPAAPPLLLRAQAFTLIELLVVIAIIALLAMLLLSTIPLVKAASKRASCASSLRQVGLAIMVYTDEADGILPVAQTKTGSIHWHNLIGPYLDMQETNGQTSGSDLLATRNVIRGCPDFATPVSWQLGYAISKRPLSKNPQTTVTLTNTNLADTTNPPNNPVALARVTLQSRRVLVGDSAGWNLDVSKSSASYYSNEDKYRHRGHPNWLFYDGHVEPLTSKEGAWRVWDPASAP